MVKCPRCKKGLTSVNAEGYTTGDLNSKEEIVNIRTEWTTFTCPNCGEEIVEGATGTSEVWEAVWGKKKNPNNPSKPQHGRSGIGVF